MSRIPGVLTLLAALGTPANDGPAPLRVSARVVTPGPALVGQGIEVRVETDGPAKIADPRSSGSDATLHRVESGPSASRFVVVPLRPGPLVIPPFRAQAGDRSGSSGPTRLAVANPPAEGRPPTTLGGVGTFTLSAEAIPSAIRLGESLEYRITLTGPAAWGSDRPPNLVGWSKSDPGLRVEPRPVEPARGDPPARTFRYRVRPGRAGRVIFPPVAVASFDPRSRSYATRTTRSVPIAVAEPPRLDPTRLEYGPRGAKSSRGLWTISGFGLVLAIAFGLAVARRRWGRTRRPVPAREVARELIDGLVPTDDGPEAARRAAGAVEAFLRRVGDRPPGVLTPPEAADAVERMTSDPLLADRAGRLIEESDGVRFGGRVGEPGRLMAEARAILERLGEGEGWGPREAAEIA